MDEILNQLLDKFEAGLHDRTIKVMSNLNIGAINYPMELTKKQCAHMLLGTYDTNTFDKRFNSCPDFPRIEGKREKYPRDAVIDWYHKNWNKTA